MAAIAEDDRQKAGKHAIKHAAWQRMGVAVHRHRMRCGDYARLDDAALARAEMEGGNVKGEVGKQLEGLTKSVDTKADIEELAANLKCDHTRFRNECIRAMETGCMLVFVVENRDGVKSLEDLEEWKEPSRHFAIRRKRNPRAERWLGTDVRVAKDGHSYDRGLAHMCREMSIKYGVEFDFCEPEEAAEVVLRHLGIMI